MTSTQCVFPHFGDFNGDNLTTVDYDALLAFSLKRADVESARSMMSTKWWDYRTQHPGLCLFLFTDIYGKTAEEWRTMFGYNPHVKLNGKHPVWRQKRVRIVEDDPMKAKTIARYKLVTELINPIQRTGLWRSMCFADHYGVPYERWIKSAFQFHFDIKSKWMPAPAALNADRVVEFILDRWEQDKRDLSTMPKDPMFLASNYVALPLQDEFQAWLMALIKARPRPDVTLANYLFNEPFAHLDTARALLGEQVVSDALASL